MIDDVIIFCPYFDAPRDLGPERARDTTHDIPRVWYRLSSTDSSLANTRFAPWQRSMFGPVNISDPLTMPRGSMTVVIQHSVAVSGH